MSKNVEDAEKLADKYFAFLLTDFGFAKVNGHYVSYEYNFGYRKQSQIRVTVMQTVVLIPYIELHDHSQLSTMGRPARYPLMDIEVPASIKKIFDDRSQRGNGMRQTTPHASDHLKVYVERWQADYDQYGKGEMEIFIGEHAAIIQRHPEILLGDLSVFPEKNESKGPVKTTVEIRQPDGRMEKYIDGKKVSKGGFTRWLISFLRLK